MIGGAPSAGDPAARAPGPVRLWSQVAAIVVLTIAGSIAGAATGWLFLGPILAMVLPLAAASALLHREGLTWRELGFLCPMPWRRFVLLALGATASVIVLANFVVAPLLELAELPPPDPTLLVDVVEGNLVNYLLFLIPVAWGSAAFGEELLVRGFLLNRFGILYGTRTALVLQALVFSLGHAYQGIGGVLTLFVVGLILGWFYLAANRNLWPVIAAHGLIDTLGITLVYLGFASQPPPS